MGVSFSEAQVQPGDFDVLPPNGSQGGWTNEQIAYNIHAGNITPYLPGECVMDKPNLCYCEICYLGFTRSNQIKCCGHCVCSQCLASIVKRDFLNSRECPFCRNAEFEILPNRDVNQQQSYEIPKNIKRKSKEATETLEDELAQFLAMFNGAIRPRLTDYQRSFVIELYRLGVPFDEILGNLSLPPE